MYQHGIGQGLAVGGSAAQYDLRDYPGTATETRKTSPVEMAREQLMAAVSRLHDQIATLENRLEYIMSPVGPSATGGNGAKDAPTPSTSRHRDELAHLTQAVEIANARLAQILERLEV